MFYLIYDKGNYIFLFLSIKNPKGSEMQTLAIYYL